MTQNFGPQFEDAKIAKTDLRLLLTQRFADSAASPLIGPVGLTHEPQSDWAVVVELKREASAQERQQLPESHLGIAVKYKVVGAIRPQMV